MVDEVHDVREAGQERLADVVERDGILLGGAFDAGEGDTDGAQKLEPEPGTTRLVPTEGLGDVGACGLPEIQPRRRCHSAAAVLDLVEGLLPGLARLGVGLELRTTATELGGLGVREGRR